ncbi:MAG: flagellar basal body L-ring protein FlgH [Sterolibacterium sp.]|nr:flagellar basal body L-ring protein FlgH [Sterolibacterium sp.]
MRILSSLCVAMASLLLAACSMVPPTSIVQQPLTARPQPQAMSRPSNGAIFQTAGVRPLYEEALPRMIGDTLTVVIEEKTTTSAQESTNGSGFGLLGLTERARILEGALTITIVEGRLTAMRLRGLERLNERYVVSRLVPDEDAPLNVGVLRQRFQMLLADPLFSRAQARLIPDVVPGRALLDIEFERATPYQMTLFASNSRPASVGENTTGAALTVRNLSGWGDSLEWVLQNGSRPDWLRRQGGQQHIRWQVPLGGQGLAFSAQMDDGTSTVLEEPIDRLGIQSRLHAQEFGISQRVLEDMTQRLDLGLGYSKRRNLSFLLGQPFSFMPGEIDGVTRIEGWRFWQEYAYRQENQALVLRSTFMTHRTNLQAMANAADPDNRIWLGQGHHAWRPATGNWQLSLRATMQYTRNRLSSLDRLSLGGRQSVRGFRENQLIRDQGRVVNVDADYFLWRSVAEDASFSAGLYGDMASGHNQGDANARLSSVGVMLKANLSGWHFDLAYALRRQAPAFLLRRNDSLQDKGIHFRLSYDVFGK